MVNIYCYKDAQPLELLGVVDDFISFSFQRSYSGIGEWQLTLNADSLNAQRIKEMKYIRVSDKVAGYVAKHTEVNEDNTHTITYTGYELKAIAARRIILPPTGYAYLSYANVSPEYVIAHLIDTQILNPETTNRQVTGTIATYSEGADIISYNGRFQNVASEIEALATAYYIGWAADIEDGAIVWKIWRGVDRTAGQEDNDRMIVSYAYDSMNNSDIEEGNVTPNYALIAGQGEGLDRQLATIDNVEAGINRNEVYIDARDITQEAGISALLQRGKEKLSEYGSDTVYNATFSKSFNDRYRIGYELGDIGTVIDEKINGGEMDISLTIVEEVYEESQLTLNVTFGYDKNTLSDAIKRLNSKSASLIATEGSGGISGIVSVEQGGTGADNAVDARTNLGITLANLGAAAANHNHSGVYAPVSHTHSYLPLTGGTLSAQLTVNSTTWWVIDARSSYSEAGIFYTPTGASQWIAGVGHWGITNSFVFGVNGDTWKARIDSNGTFNTAGSIYEAGTSLSSKYAALSHSHSYLPLSGGTITGTIRYDIPISTTANILYGQMASNDYYRILAGGASNAGYLEIATADDGNEPIYFRQYTGVFSSLVRTATILDGSGNTSFPGRVSMTILNTDNYGSSLPSGSAGDVYFKTA